MDIHLEACRLESAALELRSHVEQATGRTYGMEDDDYPDDERVQRFRAVWRAAKRLRNPDDGARPVECLATAADGLSDAERDELAKQCPGCITPEGS